MSRRWVVALAGGALSWLVEPQRLSAKPRLSGKPLAEPPRLLLAPAISFSGEGKDKHDVVDDAFVASQITTANELYAPFGVGFTRAESRVLASKHAALEGREDRDALADELAPSAVNVFFVASLRDVDDPTRLRMGVTWRKLTDLKKKYIVVASSARPTTLAHELGHFLGLDHSSVKNNLMSYDRDGGKVSLDERQGRTVRQHADFLVRSKAVSSEP